MNEDNTPETTPEQSPTGPREDGNRATPNVEAETPAVHRAQPVIHPAPAVPPIIEVPTPLAQAAHAPHQPAHAAGHQMPATFTSPGRAPGSQGTALGLPNGAYVADPAYGQGATLPMDPLVLGGGATPPRETKTFGAGKVTALVIAAALVGGGAGLGGGLLGASLTNSPSSNTATSPGAVTVNNPGSVNEATAIAATVLPSVVTIDVAGASEGGSGSGVILSEDGYILTNTHVVTLGGAAADPAIRVTTSDGKLYNATIVGLDPIYDLAVIKLDDAQGLTPIEIADSSKLNVGSTAVAVGAPLGLSNSVTTGIVSALNRSIEIASSALPDSSQQDTDQGEGQQEGQNQPFQFDIPGMQNQTAPSKSISVSVIQTDAAINPGNSGGALVDSEGRLIGINVAIATAGSAEESGSIGVGFAIPSNIAQRVAQELIENGVATHGLLGASVRDASSVEGATVAGAYIVDTPDGGAALSAGLQKGDVVTGFNGVPISGASDLTAQVRAAAAGSTASVSYVRDGKTYDIEVELGELAG